MHDIPSVRSCCLRAVCVTVVCAAARAAAREQPQPETAAREAARQLIASLQAEIAGWRSLDILKCNIGSQPFDIDSESLFNRKQLMVPMSMACLLGCYSCVSVPPVSSTCSVMLQAALEKVCMLLLQATLHAHGYEPASEGQQNIHTYIKHMHDTVAIPVDSSHLMGRSGLAFQ